jgi:hypothetical protein
MPDGLDKIVSITLPDVVTSIGNYVFYNCTNLALIELSAGLTSILPLSFSGCTSLTLVTCHAITPLTLGTAVFISTSNSLRIEVPADSVAAYKAATNWSEYANRIFAIEG